MLPVQKKYLIWLSLAVAVLLKIEVVPEVLVDLEKENVLQTLTQLHL